MRLSMLVRPSHSAALRLYKKRDINSLPTSNRRDCVLALDDPARLNAQANSRLGPKLEDNQTYIEFTRMSLRKIVLRHAS